MTTMPIEIYAATVIATGRFQTVQTKIFSNRPAADSWLARQVKAIGPGFRVVASFVAPVDLHQVD